MNKGDIIRKLKRIDEEVYFGGDALGDARASIVIVGGGAVILKGLSEKTVSKDIDVFRVEGAIEKLLYSDPDINPMCQVYSMNMPYNYEDRLEEIDLRLRTMRVLVPSPEDLAVMKLYRWEDPDISDLCSQQFLKKIDWDWLEHLVFDSDEAPASRVADLDKDSEYRQMVRNFREYESMCRYGGEL